MKIFVSYSRRDARDFAEQISETLEDEHDVFTDIDDIEAGDIWTNIIEDNISKCDIFIVLLTFASLRSSEVEKEVLQAQKKSKKIIPCVYRGIKINQLKWDLGKFQGIEFSSKYELAREVYWRIQHHQQKPPKEELSVQLLKEQPSVQPVKEQPSVQPVKEQPSVQPVKEQPSVQPVKEQPSVQPVKEQPSVQPVKEKRSKPTKLILLSAAIVSIILVLLLTYHPQDNQIPVSNDQSITTNTNQVTKITLSATDKDKNDLTAAIVDKPTHGSLSSINQATGVVTYTPNPGYAGTDKFTFKVNDGKADSNNGIVSITVKQSSSSLANSPPVSNDQSITTNTNQVTKITLSATDKDKNDLTAAIVDKPTHGSLSSINQATGVVTYTPNPGYAGTDKFTFKVNDGKADSNNGIVSITVKQSSSSLANSPPVSNDQSITTNTNQVTKITLSATDKDKNDLTAAIVDKPTHGSLSSINQATGVVTYTPNPGYAGTDKFTFKVNDGKADSNNGIVSITVK